MMKEHRIVGKIKREYGKGYYVDKEGNVREFDLKNARRRKK
ncbi:MAG: hypothetical protein ACP5L4_02030 [Thermoplasmata archaeon]